MFQVSEFVSSSTYIILYGKFSYFHLLLLDENVDCFEENVKTFQLYELLRIIVDNSFCKITRKFYFYLCFN